jgi:hypothetical protein
MTVAMTEFEGLDPARACKYGIVEGPRSGVREYAVAVLLSSPVQRLEAR